MFHFFAIFLGLSLQIQAAELCRPLLFRPEDNGIVLSEGDLSYKIAPAEIKLGPNVFRYKEFAFDIQAIGFKSYTPGYTKYDYQFIVSFDWPKLMVEKGRLTLREYPSGSEIQGWDVNPSTIADWQKIKETVINKQIKTGEIKGISLIGVPARFYNNRFGIFPLAQSFYAKLPPKVYFCIYDENIGRSIEVCSAPMHSVMEGLTYVPTKEKVQAIIKINGEYKEIQGPLILDENIKSIEIRASNAWTLKIKGRPATPRVESIVLSGEQIEVLGSSDPPPGGSQSLGGPGRLSRALGWMDTIPSTEPQWSLNLPVNNPLISAYPFSGNVAGFNLIFEKLPPKAEPFCIPAPRATYAQRFSFEGAAAPTMSFKIDETITEAGTAEDKIVFNGQSPLERVGEVNHVRFPVYQGEKQWIASRPIFRATSSEFSLRASGVISGSGDLVALAETQFNHWFESLFGWQNSYLSRQRWGLSANYFASSQQLQVSKGGPEFDLSSWTASLKYRFTPGVWGYQESVGFILDYGQLTLSPSEIPLVGAGLFWAKSLPYAFDRILNMVPWFRYPKWVDMDLIFYPYTPDDRYELNSLWRLNFHGKIMWTHHFFGELGFGYRFFDLQDTEAQRSRTFGIVYGTAGLGFQF